MIAQKTISVLISGIGGGSHGEQIMKALRLSDIRYYIVGCDVDPNSKGMVEVDSAYLVPRADDPAFIERTLDICRKHDVKAVFHGSEAVMMRLSEEREKFAEEGIYLPVNPAHVLETCQDKVKTSLHLRAHGFNVPAFMEIQKKEDLNKFAHFPAVIKPSRFGGGSANVYIVQSPAELEMFGNYLLTNHSKFIIQEYVGTPDNEYTVGVLFGSDGMLINSIAVRRIINNAMSMSLRVKNRTPRSDLGEILVISSGISQGEVGKFPAVTSVCEEIARSLKPAAPVNIQCRLVGDNVFVFEINPRFSGTTSLRAMAGYNEPDILIRKEIRKEKIQTSFPYEERTIMRGLQEVIVSDKKKRE